MWKKIVETEDTISYEKKTKNLRIRIEARLDDKDWKIFRRYLGEGGTDYIEEYQAETREQAIQTVERLMKHKLSMKEIDTLKFEQSRKPNLDIRRCYQEYTVEKWEFLIKPDKEKNILFIHNDETIEIDAVINIRYKPHEKNIVSELKKIFSLSPYDSDVNIFYYCEGSRFRKRLEKGKVIGKIEIGLINKDD